MNAHDTEDGKRGIRDGARGPIDAMDVDVGAGGTGCREVVSKRRNLVAVIGSAIG